MDQSDITARLDRILEGEIKRAFRIKPLDDELRAQIKVEGLADIPAVRFTKMNPSRRQRAEQIVVRAYQKDLQNTDILSNAQVLKLVTERGEWSPELTERQAKLQRDISELMTALYADGIKDSLEEWWEDLVEDAEQVRTAITESTWPDEDRDSVLAVFNRWLDYTAEKQEAYTTAFAEQQKRAAYSPDEDFGTLMETVGTLSDELATTVYGMLALVEKVRRFQRMTVLRRESNELRNRYTRMFADTVEARRDQNEEIARLFVSAERMSSTEDDAKPVGPLASKFEDMFALPTEVLQWLLEESHFFHANIPDEARDYLETFGFLRADRTSADTEPAPSDVSPDPQSSSPDTPVATAVAPNSSESAAATI